MKKPASTWIKVAAVLIALLFVLGSVLPYLVK